MKKSVWLLKLGEVSLSSNSRDYDMEVQLADVDATAILVLERDSKLPPNPPAWVRSKNADYWCRFGGSI